MCCEAILFVGAEWVGDDEFAEFDLQIFCVEEEDFIRERFGKAIGGKCFEVASLIRFEKRACEKKLATSFLLQALQDFSGAFCVAGDRFGAVKRGASIVFCIGCMVAKKGKRALFFYELNQRAGSETHRKMELTFRNQHLESFSSKPFIAVQRFLTNGMDLMAPFGKL